MPLPQARFVQPGPAPRLLEADGLVFAKLHAARVVEVDDAARDGYAGPGRRAGHGGGVVEVRGRVRGGRVSPAAGVGEVVGLAAAGGGVRRGDGLGEVGFGGLTEGAAV